MNYSDCVYLACCYNYLNVYPPSSLQLLYEKLSEGIPSFNNTQLFYVLTMIVKAKYVLHTESFINNYLTTLTPELF